MFVKFTVCCWNYLKTKEPKRSAEIPHVMLLEGEGVKKTGRFVSGQAAHDASKQQSLSASGNSECKGGDTEHCGL